LVCSRGAFFTPSKRGWRYYILFPTITLLFRKDKRLIFDREPDFLIVDSVIDRTVYHGTNFAPDIVNEIVNNVTRDVGSKLQ
jgi:hypothetical protein